MLLSLSELRMNELTAASVGRGKRRRRARGCLSSNPCDRASAISVSHLLRCHGETVAATYQGA